MGTIHGKHLSSRVYGIGRVKSIIERIKPHFILAEIPPDRIATALAEFRADAMVSEARVSRFPEYVDAVFPLQTSVGFAVIACAGWTAKMASERRALLAEWKQSRPEDSATVDAAMALATRKIQASHDPEDPAWIHSSGYDQLVKAGMTPYSEIFGDDLGAGGWQAINSAHYSLIDAAIKRHGKGGGKRFLVIFGAWHKYWFLEQLRERNDIRIINLNEFL